MDQQQLITILAAKMPAAHKNAFQWLLLLAEQEGRDQFAGSRHGLAKLLHSAIMTFTRAVPNWVKAGWITTIETGQQLTIVLSSFWSAVPKRDTKGLTTVAVDSARDALACDLSQIGTPEVACASQSGPLASSNAVVVSNWDEKCVSNWANQTVITTNITSIDLYKNKSNQSFESNDVSEVSQIGTEQALPNLSQTETPELTPELALSLWSTFAPVPKRPTGGPALAAWMRRYYYPMADLIAMQRPLMDALAWSGIEHAGRYMAWEESGWRKKAGRGLPTPENLRNNWKCQIDQIAKFNWTPAERTPYPGVPNWDNQAELTPAENGPNWDSAQPGDRAQPYLLDEAEAIVAHFRTTHPHARLFFADHDSDGTVLLLIEYEPEKYLPFDLNTWNNPTPEEEDLIYRAIDYGQLIETQQHERQLARV